jgi:hypothetical protein
MDVWGEIMNLMNLLKYIFSKPHPDVSHFTAIWCRIRRHPAGVIWYTSTPECGPDMRCRKCGDDLEGFY